MRRCYNAPGKLHIESQRCSIKTSARHKWLSLDHLPSRIGSQNGQILIIVVWGLSSDTYLDALWETVGFSPEFKIDLVDFSETMGRFRERIQNQAVLIQNGDISANTLKTCLMKKEETGEVNRQKLIVRITDECSKIERTVRKIREGLPKTGNGPC